MTEQLPLEILPRDPFGSPRAQLDRLRRLPIAREHGDALRDAGLHPLRARSPEVLQINVGKLCNQVCRHCHMDAGPDRKAETMTRSTMEQCLELLERTDIALVDITGGAPEMNPSYRWLVESVRRLGRGVMHRCNLTILETPSHRDLPRFFAEHRVKLVCSLPHYRPLRTDRQRGDDVHDKSIRALRRLNDVGYGDGRSGLELVLVSNPSGAFLPAGQASMERDWKGELMRLYGVRFDELWCITNMPIGRFLDWLEESGNLGRYMDRLVGSFNPSAARNPMCRTTLAIGWDGTVHDCEFKQALGLPADVPRPHVSELDLEAFARRTIETDRHCYACTAGAGSSCGGSTAC